MLRKFALSLAALGAVGAATLGAAGVAQAAPAAPGASAILDSGVNFSEQPHGSMGIDGNQASASPSGCPPRARSSSSAAR